MPNLPCFQVNPYRQLFTADSFTFCKYRAKTQKNDVAILCPCDIALIWRKSKGDKRNFPYKEGLKALVADIEIISIS